MPQGKGRDQPGGSAFVDGGGVPRLQGREGRTQCPHDYGLSHLLDLDRRPVCVRASLHGSPALTLTPAGRGVDGMEGMGQQYLGGQA